MSIKYTQLLHEKQSFTSKLDLDKSKPSEANRSADCKGQRSLNYGWSKQKGMSR